MWKPSVRNATKKIFFSSSSLPSCEEVRNAVTILGLYPPSSSSLLQGENEYYLSDQCIKDAFQKMIKRYHPDVAVHADVALAHNDDNAEAHKGINHTWSEKIAAVEKNKSPVECKTSSSHFVSSSFCSLSSLREKAAAPPPSIQEIVGAYQLLRRLTISQRETIWQEGKARARRSCSTVFRGQEDFTYTPEEWERAMKIYRGYPRHPSVRTASSTFPFASTMARCHVKGQNTSQTRGTLEERVHTGIPVGNRRCDATTTARAVGAEERIAAFNARHHQHAALSFPTDAWSKRCDAVEAEKRRNVHPNMTEGRAGRCRAREVREAERWFRCASGRSSFSFPCVFPTSAHPSLSPRSSVNVSRHHHHHRRTMWGIVHRLLSLWRKNVTLNRWSG